MAKAFLFYNSTLEKWKAGSFDSEGNVVAEFTLTKGETRDLWRTPTTGQYALTLRFSGSNTEIPPFENIPITEVASDLGGTPYESKAAFETATKDFFFKVSGSGTGWSYSKYEIPAEQITGDNDTLTVPFNIDLSKSPFIIIDNLFYNLEQGITSITNATGSAVIVMSADLPLNAKATVYYSVPGTTVVTTTGSKEKTDNHTLDLTDIEQTLYVNSGTDKTITIPLNADVEIPINSRVEFGMAGLGSVIFVGDVGVTVRSVESADRITSQYGMAVLTKVAENEWWLSGVITTA